MVADKESPADRSCESCVLLFFAESIAESTGSSYGVNSAVLRWNGSSTG